MILPVIDTQEKYEAITGITGTDNSNPSLIWLGIKDNSSSTCTGEDCVGKFTDWYDGTPYKHMGSYIDTVVKHLARSTPLI